MSEERQSDTMVYVVGLTTVILLVAFIWCMTGGCDLPDIYAGCKDIGKGVCESHNLTYVSFLPMGWIVECENEHRELFEFNINC